MKRKKLLLILLFPVTVIYIIFACHKGLQKHGETICHQYDITITDSAKRQYITFENILTQLDTQQLLLLNQPYKNISTADIEKELETNPFIKKAECYKTVDGVIKVDITQREAVLRVLSEEDYFIDTERHIIPVCPSSTSYVPIFTGSITKERATGDLFDFAIFLKNNNFWNAQIVQIDVLPNQEIRLVPRVGNHIILLGTLDNYITKLNRLQKFYTQGLNKLGWQDYHELDLRYNGQVVARK